MSRKFLPGFIILIFIIASTAIFPQHTYYVSSNGNDSNDGTSQNTAFKTLQHAADNVSAGDSVIVLDGNYTGFDIRTNGNENAPIVFKAIDSNVLINQHNYKTNDGINIEDANYVVIDGFKVINQPRAGIRIAVSDYVAIKNNYCTQNNTWGIFTGFTNNILIEDNICSYSAQQHGIYVSNSGDNPIVRNNKCFNNYGCGIQLNADVSQGGDGIITNAIIEGNIIHDNGEGGGSAINLDGVQSSAIYNNLIYNNHSSGISLFMIDGAEGSKNNKIYNNTIINPSDARWTININTNSTGNILYNNILINHHSFRGSISIDPSSLQNFVSDYNIVVDRLSNDGGDSNMSLADWQNLGYETHSQIAASEDQIFANSNSGDFHLLNNSQPVDAGTELVSSIVTNDIDNNSRPQGNGYDIGAYEYESTTGISASNLPPSNFILYQNYPNPFNPSTKIKYAIPAGTGTKNVILKVFNLLGRQVAVLVNQQESAGTHEIIFNAGNLPSGIYIFTLRYGALSVSKKMIFLK